MILSCAFIVNFDIPAAADDWLTEEGNIQNEQLTGELMGYSDGYSAILYDNSNGLPTSEANTIIQSKEGFLWIGSYAGLVRYDGNTFERIDSFSGITTVKCLHEDSKGKLWIGTNENGLFVMDRDKTKHFTTEDGIGSSSVRSIAEDNHGRVYVGTTAGLSVYDEEFNQYYVNDPRVYRVFVQSLSAGENGDIFGITNEGDGFIIRDGRIHYYFSHEDSRYGNITCLSEDPFNPGYVYLERDTGLLLHFAYEDYANTLSLVETYGLVQAQYIAHVNNKLWFCFRNGIGILNGDSVQPLKNLPMDNSIYKMTVDYEGNLWFASTRQGIMKIVPNQFSDIFRKYDLERDVVNSTCIMDDQLFIATDSGLKVIGSDGSVLQELPVTSIRYPSGEYVSDQPANLLSMLDGVRIRSLMLDSQGRLWIAAWRQYGIIRYDHGDIVIYSDENGLYSKNARRVEECDDGTYLAAVTGGVNVIKGDEVVAGYSSEDGIANTEILCVENGDKGEILCGTDGGGIYILKDGKTIHIGENEGLTSGSVMRIKYDPDYALYWVVTGNSLAWISANDYQLHTVDHFPYSNNFDLYKNKDDIMWILSSNGIYAVPTIQLINNKAIDPLYYGISNGLPCIATANSYSWLTEEGNLYIAGASGVARININTPYVNITNLKASVPYIEADDQRIWPDADGNFKIDSSVRKLTIHTYVYNYSLIDPQVTYRLKGFDNSFTTVRRSDLGPISYTNLKGGEYSFIIQLVDQMGGGNKVMSVKITKTKAITEYVWFYVTVISAALLLMILGVRSYIRYTIRKMEKKHKIETENERIRMELNTASGIQHSMVPHDFPPYSDQNEFNIFAVMDPAREVGGDFYDYFMIDDDHLCLVIADVSGKGIPAALFMMMSKIVVQSYASMGPSPADILTRTNEKLCENNPVEMFVTVWLGILEISTGKLTAANAGHEYPFIMKNGQFSLLKDKHGFVIGGMSGIKYKEYDLTLEPGDRLFIYTDGVPEATDANKNMFGEENLLKALNRNPGGTPEDILENVIKAVNDFVKDAEQFDDLTMLCLEYNGKQK